ncbi:MAG TPA: aminotransferase class I/II-fold pyridoxal phosphate-dependent enzyme, partial [Longimicrobiales bacterium]|nr:aminotransferase class I/II-fold pyridoxal phosphate-dependent enzyme [Longimicrobiales bacterium]
PAPSRKLDALPGYPLAGFKEARLALQARGVDVIDLGAGDADLAPPPAVVEAIQHAVEDPTMSRYPFQVGLPAFRREISTWMETRFGVTADPDRELLPLIGSKDGIAHLPFGYLDPGDLAIIPDPGYQAYLGGTVFAGGEPHLVPLRPENDFLIPLDELPSDVVKRAKLLFLNYPNNPTTASASPAYYRQAIDFCREHGVVLVHDNAYSEIAFDGYRPPSILEYDGARDVAIEFHSLSKTYNMTGWRVAWAVGSQELIGTLSRVKSFVDTGVFLGVQAAGVAALRSWASWVPGNVAVFQSRRDRAVKAFAEAGYQVTVPKATMYLWIPVPTSEPSRDFARRCLDQEGVMVLPGSSLGDGGEGFFRIA